MTPLGFVYARLGNNEEVKKCFEKLDKRQNIESEVSLSIDYAVIYLGLRDYDKVFEYLEKGFNEKLGGLVFLRTRHWREIQNDPRFNDLLKRMNLPLN